MPSSQSKSSLSNRKSIEVGLNLLTKGAFQAFKLLEEKYQDYEDWIEDTRQKVDVAIAELDRDEGVDGPTAMDRYLQKFQTARQTLPS